MGKRITGRYVDSTVGAEKIAAFVPLGLPPRRPPLAVEGRLAERVQEAAQALGRLNLAGELVPSLDWFIYAFVRKEAVITSQIEGTNTTLLDLLAFEAQDQMPPSADLEEVTNYLEALNYARAQIASERGLPLSMRLLGEAHKRLMRGARGSAKSPGEIRRSQNWVGGSRPGNAVYAPPPPQELPSLISDFEKYMHADDALPKLVKAGLLHVQFESIHPYLDGNGRIGRLLITLLLEHWGLLTAPLLYLSLFFKRHRSEYYRRLNAVRLEGDWEGWTDFFLHGIASVADEAVASARELSTLIETDRARLLSADAATVAALQLFEQLPKRPIVTIASVMQLLDASRPTAARAIAALERAGILLEGTGRRRDRRFAYSRYLDVLRVGTDLETPR